MESGKINFFRPTDANIQDINPGIAQPFRQREFQFLAGQTDVSPDDNAFRLQKLPICTADTIGNIVVQLFTQLPANVVCFETSQ